MDVKRKRHGTFDGTDMRGKHAPANKTNDHTVEYKTAHSFPKVVSYYARKNPHHSFYPKVYQSEKSMNFTRKNVRRIIKTSFRESAQESILQ